MPTTNPENKEAFVKKRNGSAHFGILKLRGLWASRGTCSVVVEIGVAA